MGATYRKLLMLSIAVSVLMVTGAVLLRPVSALIFGRADYHGYFNNRPESRSGSAHGQVIVGGLPGSAHSSKAGFINFILDKYSGGGRDRIGAAFIIQTMRGQHGSPGLIPVTAAEIADWRARINNPAVTLDVGPYSFGVNSSYGRNINDDIFYEQNTSAPALTFKVRGADVYQLKIECANVMGSVGLPPPPAPPAPSSFNIVGRTTIVSGTKSVVGDGPGTREDIFVHSGDRVTFSYSLRNTGGAAAPGIVWAAQGWRNGAAETPSGTRTGTATGLPPRGSPRTIRPAESFLFSGSVGSSVCRRINYDPTSSTDSTSAWSAYVCATIIATPPPPVPPATLTPYLNMTPSPTAPYGAMLRAVPGYNGPGPAARRADVAYTFTVWNDISRNGVYDAAQDSMLSNVSGPRTSRTVAGEAFPDWNEIASISRHGDRVCARVQITTFDPLVSAGSPVTRCVTLIGKQPHMSVTTGDTWAGGSLTRLPAGGCAAPSATPSIKASAFSVGGTNYGSYGGLAVGSLGTIAAFGSNGLPHEVANLSTRLLTLSNGGTYGNFGGVATCLNDAFAIYEPHATGTYAGTTVAVPAMTLTPGQRKIIVINGNALITGDIKYQDGPYASPDQLPQLVLLVRGDIKVRSDVGRIDGLYVATRSFHTCVTSAANPMSMGGACDQKQLEVNGPVIAGDALITPRVYGASVGSGYGVQAERFDLRPDFLLSEYQRAAGGSAIQTMSETELPPRF